MMVFGIATAVMAVHKLMPHAVSSLLSMEKFQAPPSSEYLSHLIEKVYTTYLDIKRVVGMLSFNAIKNLCGTDLHTIIGQFSIFVKI